MLLVMTLSGVLPSTETLHCVLPFKIRDNANPGQAVVRSLRSECADTQARATPCSVLPGTITILSRTTGTASAPAVEPEPLSLAVMLASGTAVPSVDDVAAHDYRQPPDRAPLAAFRQVPPQAVRALNIERPQGDFHSYLDANPGLPEARLDRYLIADFDSVEKRDRALDRLRRDPHVEFVYLPPPVELAAAAAASNSSTKALLPDTSTQRHLDMLDLPNAWKRATGWGLIGVADVGLSPDHPELRSFTGTGSRTGTFVPGGNYLPYFSSNLGGFGQPVDNLHENQSNSPPTPDESVCASGDGRLHPLNAGHGTHVSGLLAANTLDGTALSGVCQRCGIAARKFSYWGCNTGTLPPSVTFLFREPIAAQAIKELAQTGAQVLSLSYGTPVSRNGALVIGCEVSGNEQTSTCLALSVAERNGVAMAAAAGNNRGAELNFPASDKRVVSVGGIDASGAFWDESPGGIINNCPLGSRWEECGSNYQGMGSLTARSEAVALSSGVRSTMFAGYDWHPGIACGDSFGAGTGTDGSGLCTGTSMSTPQVAGLLGLLRSINPLAPVGDPFGPSTTRLGIRDVLAQSADRAAAWDDKYGFGAPNAASAVNHMLGVSRGTPVVNRVTPLFSLYSPGHDDYAAVATPQLAIALSLYQSKRYYSTSAAAGSAFIEGAQVPGYAAFPNADAGSPRAVALVLTTQVSPNFGGPPLTPLYLLDRCSGPACISGHDFILLSDPARVQAAVGSGYRYAGVQGYVYARCTSEPGCIPQGAERLHLKCKAATNRCTVFLERDRARFEAAAYTQLIAGSSSSVLGYAYPVLDTDGDGLPNAMEAILGTSPQLVDTNADGVADGQAYPFTGIPISDPCLPQGQCTRPGRVFLSGFE